MNVIVWLLAPLWGPIFLLGFLCRCIVNAFKLGLGEA